MVPSAGACTSTGKGTTPAPAPLAPIAPPAIPPSRCDVETAPGCAKFGACVFPCAGTLVGGAFKGACGAVPDVLVTPPGPETGACGAGADAGCPSPVWYEGPAIPAEGDTPAPAPATPPPIMGEPPIIPAFAAVPPRAAPLPSAEPLPMTDDGLLRDDACGAVAVPAPDS